METTRKRRWWQFGLRDVLWATVLVALSLGWWLDRSRLEHERSVLAFKLDRLRIFTRVRGFDIKIINRYGGWTIVNVEPDES